MQISNAEFLLTRIAIALEKIEAHLTNVDRRESKEYRKKMRRASDGRRKGWETRRRKAKEAVDNSPAIGEMLDILAVAESKPALEVPNMPLDVLRFSTKTRNALFGMEVQDLRQLCDLSVKDFEFHIESVSERDAILKEVRDRLKANDMYLRNERGAV